MLKLSQGLGAPVLNVRGVNAVGLRVWLLLLSASGVHAARGVRLAAPGSELQRSSLCRQRANLCYSSAKENGKAWSYHNQIFQSVKWRILIRFCPFFPDLGAVKMNRLLCAFPDGLVTRHSKFRFTLSYKEVLRCAAKRWSAIDPICWSQFVQNELALWRQALRWMRYYLSLCSRFKASINLGWSWPWKQSSNRVVYPSLVQLNIVTPFGLALHTSSLGEHRTAA